MSTKERLLDAAEGLIAAQGIGDVTVAQITEAAGQRNAAAVHYHFGGRDGLLDAILDRHHGEIDGLRLRRLDDTTDGEWELNGLVGLIVDPLLTRLDTESGRAFLRVQADRFVRDGDVGANVAPSMERIATVLARYLPPASASVSAERARLATTMITVRLGQEAAGTATSDRATLRHTLIDAVAAVFTVTNC